MDRADFIERNRSTRPFVVEGGGNYSCRSMSYSFFSCLALISMQQRPNWGFTEVLFPCSTTLHQCYLFARIHIGSYCLSSRCTLAHIGSHCLSSHRTLAHIGSYCLSSRCTLAHIGSHCLSSHRTLAHIGSYCLSSHRTRAHIGSVLHLIASVVRKTQRLGRQCAGVANKVAATVAH